MSVVGPTPSVQVFSFSTHTANFGSPLSWWTNYQAGELTAWLWASTISLPLTAGPDFVTPISITRRGDVASQVGAVGVADFNLVYYDTAIPSLGCSVFVRFVMFNNDPTTPPNPNPLEFQVVYAKVY